MDFKEAQELVKLPKWVVDEDVTEDDMTQGFVDAFNSFVSYLNIQTKITINKMVI